MKRKNRVWLIFFFLGAMALLTLVSRVLSEQSMPLVIAEQKDLRAVIPASWLYEIQEDQKKAVLYLVEDTGRKRNPYTVKAQEVTLKEQTEDGYVIGGLLDYSGQWIATYADGRLRDGVSVQAVSREAAEEEGTLLFFSLQGDEPERETVPVSGIPKEEEARIRSELALDETWNCFFVSGGEAGSLPKSLIRWGWECTAFFLIAAGMLLGFRRAYREGRKRLAGRYGREFLQQESAFLLEQAVWIALGCFLLVFLAQEIGSMDYGFLRDWLPEGRVFEPGHFRQVHRAWKDGIEMYALNFPDDPFAAVLTEEAGAWKTAGWHFALMGAVVVGTVGILTGFFMRRVEKEL